MKKTGEILKKAREEKGLSLHEVGIFLKINTRILQAIEEGHVEKLPAKTFLRGFIQSYANYLKLDTKQVLKIFQAETSPPGPIIDSPQIAVDTQNFEAPTEEALVPEPTSAPPIEEEKPNSPSPMLFSPGIANDSLKHKMLLISILGFLLVFVVYIGNNLIRRYQKEASVNEDLPKIESEATSDSQFNSVKIENTPKENISTPIDLSAAPISTTPLLAIREGGPAVQVSPSNSSTTSTPVSSPKPTNPTSATVATTPPPPVVSASTAPPAATMPTPPVAPTPPAVPIEKKPEGKPIEVIVEAKESVEIEYSSAKSPPQKLILKGEQIHTFKSRSGVRLKINNGGAVNVIVNGQDLGAPGEQGQSVQLNYE